jgi:fumarate reductase (CoM/CoB) subunit B
MAYRGILEGCNECGVCVEECLFLRKYALTPLQAVLDEEARMRGALGSAGERTAETPFACLLCGLCDSVCPIQLRPSEMFGDLRTRSVQGSRAIAGCRPFFSDRKYNLYSIYRSANSIDYSDSYRPKTKTILFPGCSLGTFFPKLTRALYDNLAKTEPDLGLIMDCCQKPLKDLGLEERYEKASAKLEAVLDDMGVEKIVTACPSCLRVLRERFKGRQVVSCYSMITPTADEAGIASFGKEAVEAAETDPRAGGKVRITVHDSCSDREYGVVGPQVRRLLSETKSVEMVEMAHNGRNSLCCGAGGLISAVDPKLSSDFNRQRIGEAESSGAEVMVTYCATCVNAFRSGGNPSKVETRHVLELLLGVKEDHDGVRRNLEKLFVSGPKKELYERLIQNSP